MQTNLDQANQKLRQNAQQRQQMIQPRPSLAIQGARPHAQTGQPDMQSMRGNTYSSGGRKQP